MTLTQQRLRQGQAFTLRQAITKIGCRRISLQPPSADSASQDFALELHLASHNMGKVWMKIAAASINSSTSSVDICLLFSSKFEGKVLLVFLSLWKGFSCRRAIRDEGCGSTSKGDSKQVQLQKQQRSLCNLSCEWKNTLDFAGGTRKYGSVWEN